MSGLLDFLQGASNSAAATVSAPVDVLAWALRKAGLPIGDAPVGGSDWMRQKGLTAEPQNRNMGLLGEAFGGVAPMVAAAKAPQIAQGLLQAERNLAAPGTLNPQAGMIINPFGRIPETTKEIDALTEQLGRQAQKAGHDVSFNSSNLSPSRYLTISSPEREAVQVRLSQHGDRYPTSFAGERFSVDPDSRNTYEMAKQFLTDKGFSLKPKAVKMPDWVGRNPEYAKVYPTALKRLMDSGMTGKEKGFESALGTEISVLLSAGSRGAASAGASKFVYPQEKALATAQANATKPISEGGLGLPANNTAAQRAQAMGFDVEMPLYHGTGADIKAFDPRMAGKNDRGLWGKGQYLTTSPDTASSYALREGDGSNVIPAYIATKNPMNVTTGKDLITRMPDGSNTRDLIGNNLDGSKIKEIAQSSGYDSVFQVKPNGDIGDIVTYNPANIRSRFAAFDPARRNEADLLGSADPRLLGLIGAGVGGGVVLSDNEIRKKIRGLITE